MGEGGLLSAFAFVFLTPLTGGFLLLSCLSAANEPIINMQVRMAVTGKTLRLFAFINRYQI